MVENTKIFQTEGRKHKDFSTLNTFGTLRPEHFLQALKLNIFLGIVIQHVRSEQEFDNTLMIMGPRSQTLKPCGSISQAKIGLWPKLYDREILGNILATSTGYQPARH